MGAPMDAGDRDAEDPLWFDELGECVCDHQPHEHSTEGCRKCDCPAYWGV